MRKIVDAAKNEHLLFISVIGVINFVIYFDYWTGATLFTGKDTFTCYMPLMNFQTDCLGEGSFPLWNPFMNFGFPYVEHTLNSSLFPTHFLMGLLTGSTMLIYQRELLFWIFLGGIGVYLCVREFGKSGLTGMITAVSFMFCGQLIVLPTWSIILYNACCFPYLILGYHHAKNSGTPFSVISILFFALPLYSGYVSSSVHGIYYFAGYVLIDSLQDKRLFFGLKYLVMTFVPGFLLAFPKLLPVFLSMGNYERMSVAEVRANPLEIIGWYNMMSFVLPVKYYFSVFVGQLAIISLIFGAVTRKLRVSALLLMFLLSGWLLMVDRDGSFSLLHQIGNAVLPMLKLTRNEWMYWNYPLTFLILYSANYMDSFLFSEKTRFKIIAVSIYAVTLTIIFVSAYDVSIHLTAYIVHIIIAAVFLGAAFLTGNAALQKPILIAVVLIEFLLVFNRVSVDGPASRNGEFIDVVLTHQVYASGSFRDGELVHQTMPIRVLSDESRPSIAESGRQPYLISGLDGNFVDNMNQKRFTGWWYNTQERADFVALKNSPLLSALDGQPLFEYVNPETGSQASGSFVLNNVSCSGFNFGARSNVAGLFILRQMYDDRWKVIVDGKEQPLRRVHEFFMGTEVGPGMHTIAFRFRDRTFMLSLAISGMTLFALILAGLIRMKRRMKSAHTLSCCD